MDTETKKVIRVQPSGYKVLSSDEQTVVRSPPTGIRGGGGSYFHLIYGCLSGACVWCIMEIWC